MPQDDHDALPTSRTYAELWQGAEVLLRKGRSEETGSRWVFLSALLMLSLCLEAYLNFAGALVFGSAWNEGPQPHAAKDVRARLRLVAAACGVELESRRTQMTVVATLLDLRAGLTRAHQQRLVDSGSARQRERREDEVDPAWSPYCRASIVQDYQGELKSLLMRLHAALPDDRGEFLAP